MKLKPMVTGDEVPISDLRDTCFTSFQLYRSTGTKTDGGIDKQAEPDKLFYMYYIFINFRLTS